MKVNLLWCQNPGDGSTYPKVNLYSHKNDLTQNMKVTSPKKRKRPNPKYEDNLSQKFKTIYPNKEDDLTQKMKTTSPKNEDDLTQKLRRPYQKNKMTSLPKIL